MDVSKRQVFNWINGIVLKHKFSMQFFENIFNIINRIYGSETIRSQLINSGCKNIVMNIHRDFLSDSYRSLN